MITFNRNSWHFRLATTYGPMYRWEHTTDICRYTRSVFFGLLLVLVITAGLGLITWGLVDMGLWLYFLFNGYLLEPIGPAIIIFASILVGLVVGTVFLGFEVIQTVNISTPSFVKQAYYSWKDKYCSRVEFK